MTIPSASNSFSCYVRSQHTLHHKDGRESQAIRKTRSISHPTEDYTSVAPNIRNSVSCASSSKSSSSSWFRSPSLRVILTSVLLFLLLVTIVPETRAEDPKYSFNGFAGGLILDDSSSSASESVLTKRSPSDEEAIEELPSPSALRVDDKAMPMMPEISLPTVTVRGFLNLRTTIDGTVIVFTPSSTAAASTASPADDSSTRMQYSSAMYMGNNPFSYTTSTRTTGATQWSTSYRPTQIHASPVQSSASAVYPTGVVTVIADTNTGDNGIATVQETKVIGTFIDGKYAQILKSSSYIPSPTPIIPSGTFAVYQPETSTKKHELRRPSLPRNSIHTPRSREKSEAVTRFTRGDRGDDLVDGPTEPSVDQSRVKVRKPIGRLPGSNTGRYTWNRPASERVRLNRFKVKVAGDATSGSSSARFTARDENEREAAKVLNRRLNRRLGISRSAPLENRSPAAIAVPSIDDKDHHRGHRDESESPRAAYDLPLMEGMLAQPAGSPSVLSHAPADAQQDRRPVVVTDTTTILSEVTRGFVGGEPLIETMTETSTIERTIEATPAFIDVHPTSDSVTLASGMMNIMPDNLFPSSPVVNTPPLPFLSPAVVVSRTFTLTESSSRTSLYPSTDGSITTTHTITENLVIRKLITGAYDDDEGERKCDCAACV